MFVEGLASGSTGSADGTLRASCSARSAAAGRRAAYPAHSRVAAAHYPTVRHHPAALRVTNAYLAPPKSRSILPAMASWMSRLQVTGDNLRWEGQEWRGRTNGDLRRGRGPSGRRPRPVCCRILPAPIFSARRFLRVAIFGGFDFDKLCQSNRIEPVRSAEACGALMIHIGPRKTRAGVCAGAWGDKLLLSAGPAWPSGRGAASLT